MNRGSDVKTTAGGSPMASFNEAPIHESGKSETGWKPTVLPAASMRPRFMNRGSILFYRLMKEIGGASMRPRFMNRGSMGRAFEGVIATEPLQ